MSVDHSTADPFLMRSQKKIEVSLGKTTKSSAAIMNELWLLAILFRLEESSYVVGQIKQFLRYFESLVCSDYRAMGIDLLERINNFKEHDMVAAYEYPGTIKAAGTTPLGYKLVVEYIDNVVERLFSKGHAKITIEMIDGHLVVDELRRIKKFIVFLGKICSSEGQSWWQNFLYHVEYVSTLAAE